MNASPSTVDPPAKRSLGSAFKKIVNNGEAAITRLREMAARRDEITQKYDDVLAEAKKVQAQAEAAERDFNKNPSADLVRKLCELRPQGEVAREIFSMLYRSVGARSNDEFNREHAKDLRPTLLKAAKHLLAQAQETFDAELAHSREALGKEGFDDEAISQSPKVRHAEWRVEKFERLVDTIKSSADEQLWQNASALLEK